MPSHVKTMVVPRAARMIAVCVLMSLGALPASTHAGTAPAPAPGTPDSLAGPHQWSLDECLASALRNNHARPASRLAVAIAEAQHRQALAGYWPQLAVEGGWKHIGKAPNFLFPSSAISLNLGMGPMTIPIPAQDVKLMDPDSYVGSAHLTWLLWDGGMRGGYREMTAGQVQAMREQVRRTDLEVVETVRRYYWGALLARRLRALGELTLERMQATLGLTETMYREGSGKVKKTDYLDNKVMVESMRALVASLEKNEAMAEAALANACGLPWTARVRPSAEDIPFSPVAADPARLVGAAYEFNPDWKALQAGLAALQGGVRTARSGWWPKLALTGELHRWENDYDSGLVTDQNTRGGSAGVMVSVPVFDGFLTAGRVAEARARWSELNEKGFLLHEGLGLMVQDIVLGLDASQKECAATLDAMNAAGENRDLNTRAYQNELVETSDVIRSQLVEALMQAQHDKALYDHVTLRARLDFVVGTEVSHLLEGSR